MDILLHIAKGVLYLHKNGMAHHDLKVQRCPYGEEKMFIKFSCLMIIWLLRWQILDS